MSPEERSALIEDIRIALQQSTVAQLSDEEHQWVKMAIKKEAQSIALRQAIIEKSITSLVWSFIVGAGLVFLDYLRTHGLRI